MILGVAHHNPSIQFQKKINANSPVPGWSQLLPYPGLIDDRTVALFMAMILFLIPSRSKDADTNSIMSVDVFGKIPWGIVILFGGGFALAKGFQTTGLSTVIGSRFAGLAGTPPFFMINTTCFSITFLTELTSNTATTEMILPILASVAIAIKTNPLFLMIPATLSASCAFMMPVATPPNAIVFGSGRIRITDMVKVGLFINLIGVLLISIMFYILGAAVFSINPDTLPGWAVS